MKTKKEARNITRSKEIEVGVVTMSFYPIRRHNLVKAFKFKMFSLYTFYLFD